MSKDKKTKQATGTVDPHAEREQRRYERPIPSREYILEFLSGEGAPLQFEAIAAGLGLTEEADQEALDKRLNAMVRDGQLIRNRRGAFCLVDRVGLVNGTVIAHRDGFGFVSPDEGGDDIFMPPREMRSLMHGDHVSVRVGERDRRGRRAGTLARVLERNTEDLVGRYFEESGISFVVPDNSRFNQDIIIPPEMRGGARHGQIVVVVLEGYPKPRKQPVGRVERILGDHREPGMEVDIALHSHGIPWRWPEEVDAEIADLTEEVPEESKQGRKDFRDLPLVTIDGADAKDFDDAVYCERKGSGFRLLVAIADVAHYVTPDSALDREAYRRGTSVYFPGRVVPMLPEVLSNGLCSLNPNVDRLCMVCEMEFDGSGSMKKSRIHEGVLRSQARLTYEQAWDILQGDASLREEYAHAVDNLESLHQLYGKLAERRKKRGAIDFETPEPIFHIGEHGKVESVGVARRNDAHKIIEECMIAANVATGEFLQRQKLPTLYRVHDKPDSDKIADVREFLMRLGIQLGGGEKPEPKHFAAALEQGRDRHDAELIQTVLLRSLKQAVYSPSNIGHFGLAHETYLHFTSPIRRYPDLIVHRGLKYILRNRGLRNVLRPDRPEEYPYGLKAMERIGGHCSHTERRADEATRDAADTLKCEFMQDKVGEVFEGMVVGVTGFGLFVQIRDYYIEGLVHVTALPNDYYRFESSSYKLVGERSGRSYQLTDDLKVQVVRVDPDEGKIDLELVEDGAGDSAASSSSGKSGAGRGGSGRRRGRKKKTSGGGGEARSGQDSPQKTGKKAGKKSGKKKRGRDAGSGEDKESQKGRGGRSRGGKKRGGRGRG